MGNYTPHSKKQEAKAMFAKWRKSRPSIKDALLWLYENDWYFQTETDVWTRNTLYDEFQSFINDTASPGLNILHCIFEIQDTYIYFKSPRMEGGGALLKEGASSDPDEANDWPNNVIQLEVGFRRAPDSINKSVVLS